MIVVEKPAYRLELAAKDAWLVLRWIVGIAAAGIGIYLLFRWAPALHR